MSGISEKERRSNEIDNEFINFLKNPLWALIIGVFLSLPLITTKGFNEKLNGYFQKAGSKSAIVILITGAGGAFGAEGYFRMSYAASEAQLREAIDRIKKALWRLS